MRVLDKTTGVSQSVIDDHLSKKPKQIGIHVANANLQFPLGQFTRGSLKTLLFSLFGHREKSLPMANVEALKGISFDISRGERVGLIGHNGAGKSSLLRALAGIYPLRSGLIEVHGRVGALLDVGLGFEPESTGRENIYYRGMSMGMSRKQMSNIESEIEEFADLGEFMDLPMRTYSTGMFVRLGFAVSTQFRPDILLIDEVFGAGDALFQEKALARMQDIVEQAGIVVIATHDLGLVENLCTRAIVLSGGSVLYDGAPQKALEAFDSYILERSTNEVATRA